MEYTLLSTIESPQDIKELSQEELLQLCDEIREKLIDVVSVNGGHLSSNLGVVELTVALHKAFDCPRDSIVFDVGHQCYTHKMLTGRFCDIDTIRREGGLSGFPKTSESSFDAFNAGHASTSISAAYGIAKAKQIMGEDSYTVAVIGDGSLTGGLAYEALNNAGRFNKNFIVILNDNKMSISKNVGAMARYLTSIRMKPWYLRLKNKVEITLSKMPLIGTPVSNSLKRQKTRVKHILYRHTIFDKLGFSYYGPVDGHDLNALDDALNTVKRSKDPAILHVVTTKGKGYVFAENDSATFHGIGSFNIDTGEPVSDHKSFSDAFGEALCAFAEKDRKICAVTAAMRTGTGLVEFSRLYKDRFFDVGIAEEYAVTFSAGLAMKRMIPVFAVYSTFLQRSYDQILHDAAMQNAHIVLGVDRAGVVGEDGETHQGLFDVSMLSAMPNVTIYSPCYYDGLKASLNEALYHDTNVVSVRYPRGSESEKPDGYTSESPDFDIYGDTDADILIVTYGRLFCQACQAYATLKEQGVSVCILKLCRIKPMNKIVYEFAMKFSDIYFFEEGMMQGGVGETFEREMSHRAYPGHIDITAVDGEFVQHATVQRALEKLSLDAAGMTQRILKEYHNEEKT